MDYNYTDERNVQIVLYLLKANGIRKVIASPGATNITIVASMQQDPFFEMYSCVDERSAAYMACGMAEESGEPVVLSCTGATSSREYMPGLTEAYYRKLPIIAITSSQFNSRVGHLITQVTNRSTPPVDTVVGSFCLQPVKDSDDEWDCMIKMNKAISLLSKQGGGPVHINLITSYSKNYSIKDLPKTTQIKRVTTHDQFPELPKGKIGVFVGSHHKWSQEETNILDKFCEQHNGVVFCDHTSNYKGKYRVLPALIGSQEDHHDFSFVADLCIHIGEMSGNGAGYWVCNKNVWRVNEDGIIRDTFKTLSYIFEMSETDFFRHYIDNENHSVHSSYYNHCINVYQSLFLQIPEDLPFSNLWIAKQITPELPENSVLHLGILNSLRTWNLFEIPATVSEYSNIGGFGIDGNLSSLIGASQIHKDKLYFGVFGDLSTFYDINSLANRHVGNNVRLLIVNNGKGAEFRMYNHPGARFGEDTDWYIAAAGHNGNKSEKLLKNFVENLGYKYISASNKKEFMQHCDVFLSPVISQSIVFEIFTDNKDESDSLNIVYHIAKPHAVDILKSTVRSIVGQNGVDKIKEMLKK